MSIEKKIAVLVILVCVYVVVGGSGGIPIIDPPDPAPIPVPGLHVLIVEETANRGSLPLDQLAILQSTQIREHVRAAGGLYRQFDEDQQMDEAPQVWQDAMKLPRDSVPWWIVSDGKTGVSAALPATLEEAMATIRGFSDAL